jgi:hypothetical protein
LCPAKETNTKVKRWPTEWVNIVASYSSNKGYIYYIFRIYKELTKLNTNRTTIQSNLIKKWAINWEQWLMPMIPATKEAEIRRWESDFSSSCQEAK